MTPQGSRSLNGHDQPHRITSMRWLKLGTITITVLAYQTSLKTLAGKKPLGIIGRQRIHNTAHWRCGIWDGCTNMGTVSHRFVSFSTYEFLETEHCTGFPSGEAPLRFCPGDKRRSLSPSNPIPLPATRAQLMAYLDRERRWPQPLVKQCG